MRNTKASALNAQRFLWLGLERQTFFFRQKGTTRAHARFYNFSVPDASRADLYSFGRPVHRDADSLQIWQETASIYAGNLSSDATLFLRQSTS